ncbi:MAG: type II secretion system protein N [Pseudomonadota bacterium]
MRFGSFGRGQQLALPAFQKGLALLLWAALAIQCARLVWATVVPIGTVGDWRPATIHGSVAANSAASGFDPFFRLNASAQETVVTSLTLKLFGVRMDMATGRGSAIIETADGVQSSFAVGDEIEPGVTLKMVSFDNVTIDRGGVAEQIFLDQSVAAPVAQPSGVGAFPAGETSGSSLLANSIEIAPLAENGKIKGMALNPKGDGALFKAAGLEPGDVLTAVNGKSVSDGEDVRSVLAGGGTVSLDIERGGRRMTVSAKTGQ